MQLCDFFVSVEYLEYHRTSTIVRPSAVVEVSDVLADGRRTNTKRQSRQDTHKHSSIREKVSSSRHPSSVLTHLTSIFSVLTQLIAVAIRHDPTHHEDQESTEQQANKKHQHGYHFISTRSNDNNILVPVSGDPAKKQSVFHQ